MTEKIDDSNLRKKYRKPEITSRAKSGRAFKFCAERYRCLIEKIGNGLSFQRASWAAGITPTTFVEWRKQGWRVGCLPALSDATKKAESEYIESTLEEIKRAKTWQARAWILERRWPDEFGRRERREISIDTEIRRFVPRDGGGYDMVTDHESLLEDEQDDG